MNLSHREAGAVFAIMRDLAACDDASELRSRVGVRLLDLFSAQYFASYVWEADKRKFCDRVFLNMDESNLDHYEAYFQYRDPITPILQKRRHATAVSEIISRERLERSEFFNDFLARDGLHFGMNLYAYSASRNLGDLRIWRGRHGDDFTRRDIALLDAIAPAFTQALLRCARGATPGDRNEIAALARIEEEGRRLRLTRREKEIAKSVLDGKSDRTIGEELCISFPTVRTHLQKLYAKFEVSGRAQLARALAFGAKVR